MPLSENEQRILRQIEQQLERDPTFSSHGYRVPRGRVIALTLAVVAGLAATVLALSIGVWLAIVGFVATVGFAVALEREVRLLAREKVGTLPVSAWLGGSRRPRQPRRRGSRAADSRDPDSRDPDSRDEDFD